MSGPLLPRHVTLTYTRDPQLPWIRREALVTAVMLAAKAAVPLPMLFPQDWHFSVKLDGFRGVLAQGRLFSRNGRDLS
jgi:ATP-dependent DNA ligase